MRASGVSSKAAKEQLELVNILERKAHEAAKNVERMDTKLKQELTCVECGGVARCICTTECFPHSGILTVFPSFLLPFPQIFCFFSLLIIGTSLKSLMIWTRHTACWSKTTMKVRRKRSRIHDRAPAACVAVASRRNASCFMLLKFYCNTSVLLLIIQWYHDDV